MFDQSEKLDEWIDQVADRFEDAWRSGDRPRIADYVQAAQGADCDALIGELIKIDFQCRLRRGEKPKIDNYAREFPEILTSEGLISDDLVRFAHQTSRDGVGLGNGDQLQAPQEAPGPASCDLPRTLGRFQLLELVGEGSFGAVYKSRDTELDRLVAIKVPRAGSFACRADSERFLREARSAAMLTHPSIVPVHEIAHDADLPYIVSDYVEGQTLADLMVRRPPGFRESAELLMCLAEAVDFAHHHDIIHRDLNPRNILIDAASRPHITDFGLARPMESQTIVTLDGQVVGTPAYMAPEQASGQLGKVDGRSDVYSLGVVLYELLTGGRPFRGNTYMLLQQVLKDEPRPPRRIDDRIPRDLETICLKAMAKAPAHRYTTAGQLAEDLRRFLNCEPITARPVGNVERIGRWCRRRPAVAGLVTAVGLTLMVGTGIASFFAVRAADRSREAQIERERAQEQQQVAADMSRLRIMAENQSAEAHRQREKAQRYLYISQVSRAARAWDEARLGWIDELLGAWDAKDSRTDDLHGFEWHYLTRLRQSNQRTLFGHKTRVISVAFSPDGRWLASGSDSGGLAIWESSTGRLVQRRALQGVPFLAFSPDGRRLASTTSTLAWGIVSVWDATTAQLLFELAAHGPTPHCVGLAFDSNGKRLASAHQDGTLRVWDLQNRRQIQILKGHTERVVCVAFAPDGQLLASASGDHTIRLWDPERGTEVRRLVGHGAAVSSVAFAPNGRQLASASADRTVKKWDVATGKELLTCKGHTWTVTSVAYSPDGRYVASGSQDRTVRLWEAATGREQRSFRGHTDVVSSVAFSPDGRLLATGSHDQTVKIWDPFAVQEARTLTGHAGGVYGLAVSPDGRYLASASSDQTLRIWDTTTGQETKLLASRAGRLRCVAFSADGKHLASGGVDGAVTIWEAATGKALRTWRGHSACVYAVAFSPDGRQFASASLDQTIKIWTPDTAEESFSWKGHVLGNFEPAPVRTVAYSPDGSLLVSGGNNHIVRVWDVKAWSQVRAFKGHAHWINCVRLSPDGRLLASASDDQTIRIWDLSNGRQVHVLNHTREVDAVAFSPDGKRLASGSYDGSLKIWDVLTGQEVLSLRGHDGRIPMVVFAPDGSYLASASADGTIKLWDATLAKP